MSLSEAKRQAAERALTYLPEVGCVGLGTGSTARYFVAGVGRQIQQGYDLQCVPTSEETRLQALSLSIPLLDDVGPWELLLTVDGADEVDEEGNLIKGGGGALTREKIVNHSSQKNIIVVDGTKCSKRLGEKWAIPIEVLPFGHQSTREQLGRLGSVTRRLVKGRLVDDQAFVTDSGNFIYDLNVGPIENVRQLDLRIKEIPGVVETGLFIGRADVIIVADEEGITVRSIT